MEESIVFSKFYRKETFRKGLGIDRRAILGWIIKK